MIAEMSVAVGLASFVRDVIPASHIHLPNGGTIERVSFGSLGSCQLLDRHVERQAERVPGTVLIEFAPVELRTDGSTVQVIADEGHVVLVIIEPFMICGEVHPIVSQSIRVFVYHAVPYGG